MRLRRWWTRPRRQRHAKPLARLQSHRSGLGGDGHIPPTVQEEATPKGAIRDRFEAWQYLQLHLSGFDGRRFKSWDRFGHYLTVELR
jgi:hypothetical protein